MIRYRRLMGPSKSLRTAAYLLHLDSPDQLDREFPGFCDTHVAQTQDCERTFIVTILTLTGGPNRAEWSETIEDWRKYVDFLSDEDCDADSTFMYFRFKVEVPEKLPEISEHVREQLKELDLEDEALPMDRYRELNALIETRPDHPRVKAALGKAAEEAQAEEAADEGAKRLIEKLAATIAERMGGMGAAAGIIHLRIDHHGGDCDAADDPDHRGHPGHPGGDSETDQEWN